MGKIKKTVDECIQILVEKNGYIATDIPIALVPEGHPAWNRKRGYISSAIYEKTINETDEVIEIYKQLVVLFRVLEYKKLEEDYTSRLFAYYNLITGADYYQQFHLKPIPRCKSNSELAEMYVEYGYWYKTNNEYQEYIVNKFCHDKAIKLYKEADANHESDIAFVYKRKGNIIEEYKNKKTHKKIARGYYKQAIEWYLRVLPENAPEIADIYLDIALTYNYKKAKEYCDKALEILPENHPLIVRAYYVLGCAVGEFNELAYEYYKKALDFGVSAYDDLITLYKCLFHSSWAAKKYNEAIYYGEKWIEIHNKLCSFSNNTSEYPKLNSVYEVIADIYRNELKIYDKAKYYYLKKIESYTNRCNIENAYDVDTHTYYNMVSMAYEFGKYDEAVQLCDAIINHIENKEVISKIDRISRKDFYFMKAKLYKKLKESNLFNEVAEKALIYEFKWIEELKAEFELQYMNSSQMSPINISFDLCMEYNMLAKVYELLERYEESDKSIEMAEKYKAMYETGKYYLL